MLFFVGLIDFGYAHGIQNFPGQGSHPHHSSDNAISFKCLATRELPKVLFKCPFKVFSAERGRRNTGLSKGKQVALF